MELSPMGLLFLLVLVISGAAVVLFLIYRHGRKVGNQTGYIRGYKEGQQGK